MGYASTVRLKALLRKASEDDLYTLMQYNFGKDCPVVDIKTLVKEIKYNGSNDFAYAYRGKEGVEYSEIVHDVARKLKVNHSNHDDEETIESLILIKVLEKFWKESTAEEKEAIEQLFKKEGILKSFDFKAGFPLASLMALVGAKASGLVVYKLSAIIANIVSKQLLGFGLKFAANQALSKGIGLFLGPIGWTINGIWLAVDLAGPAYRKTIPSVLHIAYLRQKAKLEDLNWEGEE